MIFIGFSRNVPAKSLERSFEHHVIPRYTEFRQTANASTIHDINLKLVHDSLRNDMIADDVREALDTGGKILLLTERVEHVELLAQHLQEHTRNLFVLHGRLHKKHCREVLERFAALADGEPRLLIATGRFIGEGFDQAALDTLFFAMPFSWRGTLARAGTRSARMKQATLFGHIREKAPCGRQDKISNFWNFVPYWQINGRHRDRFGGALLP